MADKKLNQRPQSMTTTTGEGTPMLGNVFTDTIAERETSPVSSRLVINKVHLRYYEFNPIGFPGEGDPMYNPDIPIPIPANVPGISAMDDDGFEWLFKMYDENGALINQWVSPTRDLYNKLQTFENTGALSSNVTTYNAGKRYQSFTDNVNMVVRFDPSIYFDETAFFYTFSKHNADGTFTPVCGFDDGNGNVTHLQQMIPSDVEGKKVAGDAILLEQLTHGTKYYLDVYDANYNSMFILEYQNKLTTNMSGVAIPDDYITGLKFTSVRSTAGENQVRFYVNETNLDDILKYRVSGVYSSDNRLLDITSLCVLDGIENINTDLPTDVTNLSQSFTVIYTPGGNQLPVTLVIGVIVVENDLSLPTTVAPACWVVGDPVTTGTLRLKLFAHYESMKVVDISGPTIDSITSPIYQFVYNPLTVSYEATNDKIGAQEEVITIGIRRSGSSVIDQRSFRIKSIHQSKDIYTNEDSSSPAVPSYMVVNTVNRTMTFEDPSVESVITKNTYAPAGENGIPTHFEVRDPMYNGVYTPLLVDINMIGSFPFIIPTTSSLENRGPLIIFYWHIVKDANGNISEKYATGSDYKQIKIVGA